MNTSFALRAGGVSLVSMGVCLLTWTIAPFFLITGVFLAVSSFFLTPPSK